MQRILFILTAILTPSLAVAHAGEGVAGGLVSGLLHPVLGPDHLVAMVAVGLWGAQLGRPLLILLPLAFPLVMALGGVMGLADLPLPGVEIGIALSALILGLVVAMAFRAPVWLAVVLVGVFAVFHGFAHGKELPEAASPIAYGIGFMLATGMLHLAGIAIGLLNDWKELGPRIVRGCGAAIALLGLVFLGGALGLT
ncbi:MAG: HupE/UreJ family protein [Pseudomonadota bacterium]